MTSKQGRAWWRDAVIYQVYIRSFQDSNGDGIGDLEGVIARLDHLVFLGADAIWLSPIHPSPMLDGGYDVSDFLDVDPRFGNLATFDRLLAEAHSRDLKVVLDFVPNHTSDQHRWFQESRASLDNPKRDWYVWRDGQEGGPPNNWRSMLSGPAWTHDPRTDQYHYHAFLPEQPDLNWRNPTVRDVMLDVMRFWLERGVDGFRVDAVPHLVEDDLLRDDLPEHLDIEVPVQSGLRHVYTSDRPENLDCLADMRAVIEEWQDRVLIGEAHLPTPLVMRYHGIGRPALHMPFNFTLLQTPWDAQALAAAIDRYLCLLPPDGCPNWVVGNHDEVRVASRIGPEQARGAALLAFTLGGTPLIYNGDELGVEDVPYGRGDLRTVPEMRHPDHALKYMPHRSPMPWDDGHASGFSTGEPWLPVGTRNATRNVTAQIADERSVLALYRRLIGLRRASPALLSGEYSPLRAESGILAFDRVRFTSRYRIALNMGAPHSVFRLSEDGAIALSTFLDREGEIVADLQLRPHEGVIIRLGGDGPS